MLTQDEFQRASKCKPEAAAKWVTPINAAAEEFGIDSRHRMAGFIAQMSVESGSFSNFMESLNYSIAALAATWPSRFSQAGKPNALALKYGRGPGQAADEQGIANVAYQGRYGNNKPGDGWLYRGRGPKQITFYDNYLACGKALDIDLITYPDILLTPKQGARAAAWFWASRKLNALIDKNDWHAVSRTINGGDIGLKARLAMHQHTNAILLA